MPAIVLVLLHIGFPTTAPGQVVIPDTTISPPPDSFYGPLPDSSTLPDTRKSPTRFVAPHEWMTPARRQTDAALAGPGWPMPPVDIVAGGDLGDWLVFAPAFDVDDAPGAGQPRWFTHWGLIDKPGTWTFNGHPFRWQRVTFPLLPQTDPGMFSSFILNPVHLGEDVYVEHDTTWGERPRFVYTFRQGDFSDTYSEGLFRGRTGGGMGLDLGATFFSSDGRFVNDNRDKRILYASLCTPVFRKLAWSVRFDQFRDKTRILIPEPFSVAHPKRNDLFWGVDARLSRPVDTVSSAWTLGALYQRGIQRFDLADIDSSYVMNSRDRHLGLYGTFDWHGWLWQMDVGGEQFELDSVDAERWYAKAEVSRLWRLSEDWTAALEVGLSDYDSDPPALRATAALAPSDSASVIAPHIRLDHSRAVPSLMDRRFPERRLILIVDQIPVTYVESGNPSLTDQWNNVLTVQWGSHASHPDSAGAWALTGHAAYVQDYSVWEEADSGATFVFRPRQKDVRSLGVAAHLEHRLFWKIHSFLDYAAKYATEVGGGKLPGYHPHKGSLMVSLIAPQWRWKVDVRLNATGLWWYGDSRIDPTGYTTSHAFRLDLSGTLKMKDLTLYAQVQNVADFPYRTRAGYPFTGHMVRFGFHVTLLD